MVEILTKPCRKCATENPVENIYCKKCGAVLGVATSVVRAQRAPLRLAHGGIRRRYVLLGVPMMVGMTAVIVALTAVLGLQPLIRESGAEKGLLNLVILVAALFVVSFFPGGLLLARMTRQSVVREATLASVLAVLLLGVLGSTVTTDLLIAACVALVPSVGAAWLGARIGGLGKRDGNN